MGGIHQVTDLGATDRLPRSRKPDDAVWEQDCP